MKKFTALKRLDSKIKQVKFATFDIEASNWTNFLIGSVYDGKLYKEFLTRESMLTYMLSRKFWGMKIYAHFGGKYDFLFFLDLLKSYPINIIDSGGRILSFTVYFNPYTNKNGEQRYKNKIEFRDSYAMLPAALKKLLIKFDCGILKGDIPLDQINKRIIDDRLRKYLRSDTVGLYRLIDTYQQSLNNMGGEMKLTTAANALDLYCRKYIPKNIMIQTYEKHNDYIRQGYFGGRTEVFKKYFKSDGKTFLNYYDINSLYPSVMAAEKFPIGNPVKFNNYKYNKNDFGFCHISVDIPKNMNIPPLPIHLNNMMLYCVGNINGVYPIPFLTLLKELNIDFKIKDALIFSGYPLFKDYVNDIYNLRLDNKDNVYEYILKLKLNSLYGKFGMKVIRDNIHKNITEEFFNKNRNKLISLNAKQDIWKLPTKINVKYTLPALSAYVTAYAQIKLYKLLIANDPYYCDTDSLFTTNELETSDKLGDIKLEYKVKEAYFLSQKLYAFKTVDKFESIDSDGNKILTDIVIKAKGFNASKLKYNDFKKAVLNKDYSGFKQKEKRIFGFKEALKRRGEFLIRDDKKKSVKNVDTKRTFKNFNSIPFDLNNI